ncbi:kinase-like domain-containing protein [Fusarium solani]|uniref:non-specific serine/threonine protein kinase n=1 Tax=Fusarium solani TaxID=169388 RepID=A0A9P9G2X1_FUSSL|nr:kinase-like domain-containing protein [Fusarium solani]KAH7230272.1 kinase-like domain-containing protein [Fusarium solani]
MHTEDFLSSQATNEDPTLPGAVAGEATVILTPETADAGLAFFEVAEWLNQQSSNPELLPAREHAGKGWTLGSLREGYSLNDLVLCLRPDNGTIYGVRRHQAVLQVHNTGLIYLQSASDRAQTYLNEKRISRGINLLKDAVIAVTFRRLRYRVKYARFSRSETYQDRLYKYLQDIIGVQTSQSALALTPTPAEQGGIKIGQWTLTTGTIGHGASGRVSVAINNKGKLVALKRMTVGKDRRWAQELQRKLEMLTSLARSRDENRLLGLVEVITDDGKGINRTADLWFVLEPAVADTLHSASLKGLFGEGDQRLCISGIIVQDLLGAVDFLHQNGWLHGDIKPTNIGIRTWTRDAKSIVLLDLDGAQKAPTPGQQLPVTLGAGGTIGWLSPEREMTGYTEKTDVWAIGVTALWMIHGRHPWNSSYNPWRHEDPTSERIRPLFHEMYTEGVANLTGIKNKALKEAIRAMIRHPYAEKNSQKGARVSAAQALDMLSGKSEQPRKKARDSGH